MATTTVLMLDAKTLVTSKRISPSMLISTIIFGAANGLPAFYDSSVQYAYEDKILYLSADGALLIKSCINKNGTTGTYVTADWGDYSVVAVLDDLKDSFNTFVDGAAADLQSQIDQLNTDLTTHETTAANTYATKTQDALKLPLSGGIMTGQLSVRSNIFPVFTSATSDSKYLGISNYTSGTPTAATFFGGFGGNAASGTGSSLMMGIRLPSSSTFLSTASLLTGFALVQDSTTAGHMVSNGAIYPVTTNVDDLGTSSLRYRTVYATTFNGAVTGNATTATSAATLTTARSIALSGGATGTATSFNGSQNIIIPVTALDASKLTGTASVSTTGNAGTATTLATARTINGVSFNGSANITITAAPTAHNQASDTITALTGYSTATSAGTLTTSDSLNSALGKIEYRLTEAYKLRTGLSLDPVLLGINASSTGTSFSAIGNLGTGFLIASGGSITTKGSLIPSVTNTDTIGASNYKYAAMYATTFYGALSGNATTATTLATARTIALSGGATGTATSFNGSANITIPVTALDASKLTGTATVSTTGNATTATTLATARTINGVSFDGSANISISATDDSKLPLTGGTITGTLYLNNPLHGSLYTTYSGSGGKQGPGYFGTNATSGLMSNAEVNNDTSYKNWLYMNCYDGTNAGGATAIGVSRTAARAFIMQAAASATEWANTAEIITTLNIGSQTVTNANYATSAGKLGSTSVGGSTKPFYLLGGVATPFTATVGSTTLPMYMNAGSLTVCGTSLDVSVTGNAATATKLATARTINGVSFDGSANITIPAAPNSHTQASDTITAMTGYTAATDVASITTSDSLNTAIGKLEKRVATNATNVAACWDSNGHLVSPVGGWSLWVTTETGPSTVSG